MLGSIKILHTKESRRCCASMRPVVYDSLSYNIISRLDGCESVIVCRIRGRIRKRFHGRKITIVFGPMLHD